MRRANPKPRPLEPTNTSTTADAWLWAAYYKHNGFGDFARSLARGLESLCDVALQADPSFYPELKRLGFWDRVRPESVIGGPAVQINAVNVVRPKMADVSAVYTMWECDKLMRSWVAAMNGHDFVIVPNQSNLEHFSEQLSVPVVKVPLGIDFDLYPPKERQQDGVFRLGAAGHLGHGSTRKGLHRVVGWFLDAFPSRVSDVRLSLKLNRGFNDVETFRDPRIEIVHEDLSRPELAEWHSSLDVYADGSTYEGWGMFPCNSLAMGRPVIGVLWGGHLEYFAPGNHIPIGHKIAPADDLYFKTKGSWAVPDHSDGVEAMRWCYDNQSQAREMGANAARSVEHLTWRRCAEGVLSHLQK